ncbi:MAG: amino acid permease [Bacteroidetes bacterium]|nr:amino acid permease [Bacteroidota bacterium]
MAVKAKKFGAFAGVFTPSILTILGVIMYMRLGWVVGNAGLINTIIIIFLAHVISLSTGLSVSSIATDKKIKAGGIYYVLSRSLGLPMGGAIGITLFVGTALSISLYLVGFAESFLSIEPIREFLGLQQDVNGFRIIGTGAILVLVIIAFISTSLAIKTQFYILGAIVLSLVSIGVGLFTNTDFHPETMLSKPATGGISMPLLFAVFFPAVTGFTAGIAMSGDLKDPKKDIPFGTMAAIIVGFIVYAGLAIAFAIFVNRNLLINDTNFLLQVAWIAPLVIAGIWGATLSSALGGILGGPRILQAIASDRIGPGIFAKGFGINNEPRNALIFIFLIAEAGILIGELNIIAGIVSMFYLTSYGFINLAFYLESWASTDFRPSFRVNKYTGLIGFIAAFGVMFQLDFLAMIAALVIVGGIYFYLKRRQLKLEYGDVWQSVWTTFMRTALQKMDNTETHERNWQPNIMLFSGGTKKRPHLLELGKSFVGTHGVLSNFDLIEQKDAKVLFPKNQQSLPGKQSEKGVFTRQQAVRDIYAGIDMIARTYGFSGLEPNTVMLGWARQTRNPEQFANLLNTFYDLDLNVILLGYDKRYGYGKYKTIDIWFKDRSNNGNLALTLTKLLLISENWQNAKARVLIVNHRNEKSEIVARKAEAILDQMRVNGRVKVINNQVEQKPFYTIVEEESKTTDLVFFEIPDFKEGNAAEFIEKTNLLLERIGTVVMISGSSSFKKLRFGLENEDIKYPEKVIAPTREAVQQKVHYPGNLILADALKKLWSDLQEHLKTQMENTFLPLLQYRSDKVRATRQIVSKSLHTIDERLPGIKSDQQKQFLVQLKTSLITRLSNIIAEQIKLIRKEQEEFLETGMPKMIQQVQKMIDELPEKLTFQLNQENLAKQPTDTFNTRFFKWRKRLVAGQKLKDNGIPYTVRYQKASRSFLSIASIHALQNGMKKFDQFQVKLVFEYRKLSYAILDTFAFLETNTQNEMDVANQIQQAKQTIEDHIEQLENLTDNIEKELNQTFQSTLIQSVESLGNSLQKIPANHYLHAPDSKTEKENKNQLLSMPQEWAKQQEILLNTLWLELKILQVEFRLSRMMEESFIEIGKEVHADVLKQVGALDQTLLELSKARETVIKGKAGQVLDQFNYDEQAMRHKINRIIEKIYRNTRTIQRIIPESVTLFTEETVNELTQSNQSDQETIDLPVSRIIDYHIQNLLMEPLHNNTAELIQSLHESVTRVEDSVRLISLSAHETQTDIPGEDYEFVDDMQSFIHEQQSKIREQHEHIEKTMEDYFRTIHNHLKETLDEFPVYRLIRSIETITQFRPQKKAAVRMQKLKGRWNKAKDYLQEQRANLWHSQSEARLLAMQFSNGTEGSGNTVTQSLLLKERLSPTDRVRNKLPFYYQQLFTGKFNFQPELWIGRKEILDQARRGLQRFKAGQKGIISITGRRRSGKSFCVAYLAGHALLNRKVYTIRPPAGGTTDPEQIVGVIREATGYTGNIHEIMHALPENSTLIFDDLELYWEKSPGGTAGLEFLIDIMKQYCQRVLFIITCDRKAYSVISRQVSLQALSIQHIELKPFNSKELQDIILLRHRTSGFALQVDTAIPATLTLTRQARLFSRIFRFSAGNVGSALLLWISSIHDFKNNTIFIHTPVGVDARPLDALDNKLKLYLMQFALHKRMDLGKIERVTQDDRVTVINHIQVLQRSGLIIEQAGPIYEITPFVYDQVRKMLEEDILNEV